MIFATFYTIGVLANILFLVAIRILVETVYSKKNGENQDKENKQ